MVVDDDVLVMAFEDHLPNVFVVEDVSKIEVRKVKQIVWFWIDRKTLLAAIKVTRLVLSFQWGVSLVYDRKMANLTVRLDRAPQQSRKTSYDSKMANQLVVRLDQHNIGFMTHVRQLHIHFHNEC